MIAILKLTQWLLYCIKTRAFSVIVKSNTDLGIKGDNVKVIHSEFKGGYILIRWND